MGMIKLTSTEPGRISTETLIIPVCPDRDLHQSSLIRSLTRQALGTMPFQGEKGEELCLHQPLEMKARRVLFMGLGPYAKLTQERFRQAAGQGVRLSQHAAKGDAVLVVPDGDLGDDLVREDLLTAMAEGALLSNHCPNQYKSDHKIQALQSIRLHTDAALARKSRTALKRIDAICRGTL
jgi:leucyl aminopeptidase